MDTFHLSDMNRFIWGLFQDSFSRIKQRYAVIGRAPQFI